MKKLLALLLVLVMVVSVTACGKPEEGSKGTDAAKTDAPSGETAGMPDTTEAQGGKEPAKEGVATFDWSAYDSLIASIKAESDLVTRRALMHQAEDMLMQTGAICPIYHYNATYMAKEPVKGFFSTKYGYKYFEKATNGDSKTLRLCLASEPEYLDPALNSAVDGAVLAVNSFSGLYTYDENGEKVPDCAESVEISEDGRTYVFTMRDGLKWSDGSELNAKDFEYSWKRASDKVNASGYRYMLNCIEGWPKDGDDSAKVDDMGVTASEDGKTLTVKLAAPTPYFLDLVAFPTFFPVKKEAVEGAEGYKTADGKTVPKAWTDKGGFVSNGPFMNVSWDHKKSLVYKKNPHFHRADNVKLEKLEFMLSDDEPAVYAAYQAGNLDYIEQIPSAEVKNLYGKNPEFHVVDELGTYYVIFNVKSEMFKGMTAEQAHTARRALALAIDRQYIVDSVGQTGQVLANTFIPPEMKDGLNEKFKQNRDDYKYPDEASAGYFPYEPNMDKAREMLKEAGFKFGEDGKLTAETPLHINYLTNKSDSHEQIAAIIQQDFAEMGITMEISTMDWKTTLAEREAGHYDVARHGWIADFDDPINMLEMWTTDSGNNDAQFGR